VNPWITHKQLATFARRSYDEGIEIEGDNEILIEMFGECLVVSPRGTEFDFQDIIRDMRSYPSIDAITNISGHTGFRKGAWACWPYLANLVLKPGLPVVLTGHSLGGSIVTWIAVIMCHFGKPPNELVAIAPAAAVSKAGRDLLQKHKVNQTIYRNGKDIVPATPMLMQKLGILVHTTQITQIGVPADIFKDHRMALYEATIP
jgi:alpha-beta hydrolase superfamily lysophospholipase